MFNTYNPRSANAYQRINVETSMHTMDQHQLVSLLFEGLIGSIATARGALARGDVLTKCNSIGKALRILEEGLTPSLDRVDGGELANNLNALYEYCSRRLILANAKNDDSIMQEVMQLIEPVATAWNEIKRSPVPTAVDAAQAAASNRSALSEA